MASDGWNYVLRVQTITNGAGGAGDQTWPVLTTADSEVEIFQMDVTNGDTVARNVSAVVDDATTTIATLLAASSLNAAAITRWPYVGGAFAWRGTIRRPRLRFTSGTEPGSFGPSQPWRPRRTRRSPSGSASGANSPLSSRPGPRRLLRAWRLSSGGEEGLVNGPKTHRNDSGAFRAEEA